MSNLVNFGLNPECLLGVPACPEPGLSSKKDRRAQIYSMRPMLTYDELCHIHLMPHMQTMAQFLFLKVLWIHLWKHHERSFILNHCSLKHHEVIHCTAEQLNSVDKNAQLDIFVCDKKRKVWKRDGGEKYSIQQVMAHCKKNFQGYVCQLHKCLWTVLSIFKH